MPALRTVFSQVLVFVVGVVLATTAVATAYPPKRATLATRVKRLENRANQLQSSYQTFCNTLKFADKEAIQDVQIRELFTKLADTCWTNQP